MIGMADLIVTANALAQTEERLFPESRHRSKRIRKKLIKRFGGEFAMKPAAFRVGNRLIVHPAIAAELHTHFDQNPKAGTEP